MKLTAIIWLATCVLSLGPAYGSDYNDPVYVATKDLSKLIDSFTVVPKWHKNGKDFWYVDSINKNVQFVEPEKGRQTEVLSRQELEKINSTAFAKQGDLLSILEFFKFSANRIEVANGSGVYTFELPGAALISKRNGAIAAPRLLDARASSWLPPQMESLSPNKKILASKFDGKLALRRPGTDVYLKIATIGKNLAEGPGKISEENAAWKWDLSSVKWSPKGAFFSILKRKQNGSPYSLITDWNPARPSLSTRPHITPLDPITPPKLYIVNVQNLTARQHAPKKSEVFHYIHQVGWSTLDESPYLAFSAVDRYYQRRDYYLAKPAAGPTYLFTEESSTYLHDHMLNFRNNSLVLVENEPMAYFLSERSGVRQLYAVDLSSGAVKRHLKTNFIIENVLKVEPKKGRLFFTSHGADKENPYHIHLHIVQNGEVKRITQLGSTHSANSFDRNALRRTRSENVLISPNGKFIIDSFSNHKKPQVTKIINTQGNSVMFLGKDKTERLEKLGWKPPESFKVKAADGKTNLYGLIYKPFDFDSRKKYPVIDFIYGGPQYIWTPQAFHQGQTNFAVSMAQLGHIVVILDARGTPGRGKAFQDFNYQKFGQVAVFDHIAAIKNLADSRPFMDLNRVGVAGSSFGGFQTLQFMTRAPHFFKAGVANASIADLRKANAESVEIYMGDPQGNRAAYEESSVASHIHKLEGKLLIMHGAQDINAPFFGMMSLMDRMISDNIMFDQFILPSVAHSRTPYVWEKMRRYLYEKL